MFGRLKTDEVDPPQAAALQRGGAVILDVREDDEWAGGHALGAVHAPLGRLSEATNRLWGQDLLTVLRGGALSGRAVKVLAAAGVYVRNVAGGTSS